MAKRKKRKQPDKPKFEHHEEVIGVVLVILAILSIVPKPFGFVGELIASFALFLVGSGYQILLLGVFITGCYLVYKKAWPNFFTTRLIGIYLAVIGLMVLAHINYVLANNADLALVISETSKDLTANFNSIAHGGNLLLQGAGIIGALVSWAFIKLFAKVGTYIVCALVIAFGIVFITGISLSDMVDFIISKLPFKRRTREVEETEEEVLEEPEEVEFNEETGEVIEDVKEEPKKYVISSFEELKNLYEANKAILEEETMEESEEIKEVVAEEVKDLKPKTKEYLLPSINLLSINKSKKSNNTAIIEKNTLAIEKVLHDFGIIGKVVAVTEGPAVTQYELELNTGTKINKLLGLNREISLALAKKDVRIEAPIPGKSTVGIELANDTTQMVGLREILEKVPAQKAGNKLLVALGKNIMGEPMFCEIDKTPHLLVAGSTGSGKSVCINGIIISILMRTKPDEVKLVLVDPKKVELSNYNGIPHLLMPVVTDPKKASVALQKIVHEMERRYDIFSEKGVKNIAGYNEWIDRQNIKLADEDKIKHMPYIVAIIDELADLMVVASKEVEDSIMRITQMARAAGIHLIVATQRPSTDVITGIVKANIPSRISFAVSSSIDSRTILDQTGAEKLLGKGDMLFFPMGESAPTRIQGSYVSDDDIERIIKYTVDQQKAQYDESFTNLTVADRPGVDEVKDAKEEYDDPLYNEIVEFCIMTGKVSASLLQRKYRLGYNRAARIIDLLEERGIIGPANGSKPREVLVKMENKDE